MKLYNTLTKKKQSLNPIKSGHVSLYTCGPTVYHYYHIGNLRTAVFNDTLKRSLLIDGLGVHHVMNITDVGHLTGDSDEGSDKMQNRAIEEGKTVGEIAEYYTEVFMQDMERLNVLPPTKYVPATSAIPQQIKMLQSLIDLGFAYIAKQAIYFDVHKLPDYGKLSGQLLSQKGVGVRGEVITDPEKRNPQDFAVWFFTVGHFADHTLHWPSPWGQGFPGWHLECSAIIERELGDTIDIHTGGVDLIGTHHTNEIAQSEAAHAGSPLSNNWVHVEFLLVDGAKMSKSLKNTYTLKNVIDKGYDPMALRMLYLQSHYRSQQNFNWEALDGATNYLMSLRAWADAQFQAGASTLSDTRFHEVQATVHNHINDDLNTPRALSELSKLIDLTEGSHIMPTTTQVAWVEAILGLQLDQRRNINHEQMAVMAERQSAREAKDYVAADQARDRLKEDHIEINDTPYGPRWRRTTN